MLFQILKNILKIFILLKDIIDNNKVNIKDSGNYFKINQIEFKTPQYLINMILNGNKYIFINANLWELICYQDKKNDSPVLYEVNRNDITFYLDTELLSFNHNKNIIDKSTLNYGSNFKYNYNKITQIFDSIIDYFNFENIILNNLKNKQNSNAATYEYLVNKNWIDKWKKCSNYENIKTNYLQNNLNNKENIMNDLIYYVEKNKINYIELSIEINTIKFTKKEEIESYLKNEALVLINAEFLFRFNYDYAGKSIKYNIFNNKIHFYFDYEILSFRSINNIISLNGIINYSNLKQLIKIFYFQKKYKSYFTEKEAKNKIFLINKKIINIYKSDFIYQALCDFLNSYLITQN